jgi:hypothetical protein
MTPFFHIHTTMMKNPITVKKGVTASHAMDFTQPVEVRGRDLQAIIAEAKAQGYHAHRMRVLPDVVYQLQFWRVQSETHQHNKLEDS